MTISMRPTDEERAIADRLVADRAALDGGTAEEARIELIAGGCLPRESKPRVIAARVYSGRDTVLLGYGRVFRLLEGCPEEARPRALSAALNLFTPVMEGKAAMIAPRTAHADDVRECLRQVTRDLDHLVCPWYGACDPDLVVEVENMKRRALALLDGADDGPVAAAPIAWWALDVYGMQGTDDSLCRLCCAVAAASDEAERALALGGPGRVVEDTPRMRADLNAFLIEHGGELSRGAGPAGGSPSAAGRLEFCSRRTRATGAALRW